MRDPSGATHVRGPQQIDHPDGRGFKRLGDLFCDRQRLFDRDRASCESIRKCRALDEFHHQRNRPVRSFESVNVRDVRMVQRCEHFGFALEPGQTLRIAADRGRQDFDGNLSFEVCISGAIDLARTLRHQERRPARQRHAPVMQLVFHTRVASAVRAPHQEIATSAMRIQLS